MKNETAAQCVCVCVWGETVKADKWLNSARQLELERTLVAWEQS